MVKEVVVVRNRLVVRVELAQVVAAEAVMVAAEMAAATCGTRSQRLGLHQLRVTQ